MTVTVLTLFGVGDGSGPRLVLRHVVPTISVEPTQDVLKGINRCDQRDGDKQGQQQQRQTNLDVVAEGVAARFHHQPCSPAMIPASRRRRSRRSTPSAQTHMAKRAVFVQRRSQSGQSIPPSPSLTQIAPQPVPSPSGLWRPSWSARAGVSFAKMTQLCMQVARSFRT